MSFTEQVRALLSLRGLSINKMLKDLSLGSGTFASWEKNNRIPTGDVLIRFADYFDVTTDYLLGRTDEKNPSPGGAAPLELSPQDTDLLDLFHQLNEEGQEKILSYAKDLMSSGNYIKSGQPHLGKKEA